MVVVRCAHSDVRPTWPSPSGFHSWEPCGCRPAHQGGGPWLATDIERRPPQEPAPTEKTVDRVLAAARAPVERGVARLGSWRISRRSRRSPNRMTPIAEAALTLERQR
ncbi:hypothetical protein SGRIM128S_08131 [Streptomyces griseomycini]